MTLLEKYYCEVTDIDTPKEVDDIMNLLEPILDKNLVLEIDDLLGYVVSQSGLYGFIQGFKLAKS